MSNKNVVTVVGFVALLWSQMVFAQNIVPENDASTGALVQVCGKLDDTDAQNFCFGFGEGIYQAYLVEHQGQTKPEFCLPKSNTDTRADILKAFLAWNKANPQFNKEPAAKSIIRFFKVKYPCK